MTSALILRNIARYSEDGRAKIRPFEFQLSPFAISRLEAGSTLTQCLLELNPIPKHINSESKSYVPSYRRIVPVKVTTIDQDQFKR